VARVLSKTESDAVRDRAQELANACLIAAAPDLLEAARHALATLRMVSQDMHRKPDAIGELEAAIKKAGGA
jgi:hypothetical protein